MRISDWSSDVCSSDLFVKLSNLAQTVGVERQFRGLLLQLGPRISQLDRHADTGPREPGEAVDRRSAVRDLDGADEFRTGVREGLDDPASEIGRAHVWKYSH